MTDEQLQLLTAAVLETLNWAEVAVFQGDTEEVISAVKSRLPGPYSDADVEEAVSLLKKMSLAVQSAHPLTDSYVKIKPREAVNRIRSNQGIPFNLRRDLPLIYEFSEFEEPWLRRVWPKVMDGDVVEGEDSQSQTDEPIFVSSEAWTGLKKIEISDGNRDAVRGALSQLDDHVEKLDLSNEQRAQAVSLLSAARSLVDAPLPPSDVIWDLIERAGAVCGIVGLILAIFTTALA